MSYRRKSQPTHNWRKWLLKNKPSLEKCGLPEVVLKDEAHWLDFLEHGFLDHHEDSNQFKLEDLSEKHLNELYIFLGTELSANEKASSIAFLLLQSLLKKAPESFSLLIKWDSMNESNQIFAGRSLDPYAICRKQLTH